MDCYYDWSCRQMYMQARYYAPVIGRFYSNDPVDAISHLSNEEGIRGFNRYSYAVNNPYKYTDPNGQWILNAIGAGIGGYTAYKAATSIEGSSKLDVGLSVLAGVGIGLFTGGKATGTITEAAVKISSKAPGTLKAAATLAEGGLTGAISGGASQIVTEGITSSPTEGTVDRVASATVEGFIAGVGSSVPLSAGVATVTSTATATAISTTAVEIKNELK
nr:RHS repeat-associated core domain-containing protein [Paraglaciecola mesophila]